MRRARQEVCRIDIGVIRRDIALGKGVLNDLAHESRMRIKEDQNDQASGNFYDPWYGAYICGQNCFILTYRMICTSLSYRLSDYSTRAVFDDD